MITTAREAHVYLDGAIQNIASNRKQSIAPEFYDMVLNNAVPEYISSKFPDRSNPKDIEGTLKRYTDFSVLKVTKEVTPTLVSSFTTVARVLKPNDALKIQANIAVNLIRPFMEINKTVADVYTITFNITDDIFNDDQPVMFFEYVNKGVSSSISVDLKNIIDRVGDIKGMFYVYDYILDHLRNKYGLNVTHQSNGDFGGHCFKIYLPIDYSVISVLSIGNISGTYSKSPVVIPKLLATNRVRFAPVSFLSSSDAKVTLSDYYGRKNMYLNPIAEIMENSIDIYYTDFLPIKAYVDYIKKPKLFDIATGQVPEINITKDFLDYAVKELLLVLNSPTYDRVVNQIIKNQ